ncbi:glycosyl transferase family 1 [Pedobacter yulinensis]|uniref:Glycosyl transferase family 1 n=1 Tax=Pedobacter yulinensis TaxID=2126353 RepID=A0A2T3HNS7_9SPHI|nr:glycosyl transferase family 1 [Pedobacter yulinensis]PST84053.1 glycosyl transferase family 1 [Pedobacter yulinensis]
MQKKTNIKTILFLAEYPDANSIKEGMSQRIHAIDRQFGDFERIYLQVSHRLFTKKQVTRLSASSIQYKCNVFLHFFFIMRLLADSGIVYFHSIQNVLPVLPCLRFAKRNKWILDIHGVVPEEHQLAGAVLKSKFYNLAERFVITRLHLAISVTNAMTRHFQKKYPGLQTAFVTYPILPSNLASASPQDFPIEKSPVRIIYSGNLQVWQNIPEMIRLIKRNSSEQYEYTILTGQPAEMRAALGNEGLEDAANIEVKSVAPEELAEYYEAAHFGFVLRDDITVNRVACPTKIVEYMNFGIIPIVKSPAIGDFLELGYDYVTSEQFDNARLEGRKSLKNAHIIEQWQADSRSLNIREIIVAK